jgi:hypothetical protein
VPAASYSGNRQICIRTSFNTKIHVTRVRWSQALHFGTVIYEVCTEPLALHATAVQRFGLWRQSNRGRRQKKKITYLMI